MRNWNEISRQSLQRLGKDRKESWVLNRFGYFSQDHDIKRFFHFCAWQKTKNGSLEGYQLRYRDIAKNLL